METAVVVVIPETTVAGGILVATKVVAEVLLQGVAGHLRGVAALGTAVVGGVEVPPRGATLGCPPPQG